MRFSLITATIGRHDEIAVLFESLNNQTFKEFELILVDQNTDGLLDELVSEFSKRFKLIHIKSPVKGLSYNRNVGLKIAQGEFIAFPDDDCYYAPNVLFEIHTAFQKNKESVLRLLKIGDPYTKEVYMPGKYGFVKRTELMEYAISFNFFIPRIDTMSFDTRLGCGAIYGSGEESDFLWQNMTSKDKGLFVNAIVYHPHGTASYRNSLKFYSYGLGWGAIYKKEIFKRKNYNAIFQYCYGIIRSIGGMLLSTERASYYYALKGRIKGFISFPLR